MIEQWKDFDLSMPECLLQTRENESYRATLEVIKKENIFNSNKLFGDFDIVLEVYDKCNKQYYHNDLIGLNGNYKAAIKNANKLKDDVNKRYFE